MPHVLAHGPLQRAQSLACYADPNEAANPTPLLRLYGRLFGGVFDPSLPFARSLAFTRQAWRDAGGFPERCVGSRTASSVAGRRRHRCVLASGADVYWEQRASVGATFKMYYRYGIGAAESGDRQLQGRDGVRLAAYLLMAPMLASRDRRAVAIALTGGAAYYSLPLLRAVRYRAGVRAALCIPLALAIKDFGKIAGAVSVRVAGLQREGRHPRIGCGWGGSGECFPGDGQCLIRQRHLVSPRRPCAWSLSHPTCAPAGPSGTS